MPFSSSTVTLTGASEITPRYFMKWHVDGGVTGFANTKTECSLCKAREFISLKEKHGSYKSKK